MYLKNIYIIPGEQIFLKTFYIILNMYLKNLFQVNKCFSETFHTIPKMYLQIICIIPSEQMFFQKVPGVNMRISSERPIQPSYFPKSPISNIHVHIVT